MPGTLYIVATPIGNLADVTYRAIETLRGVDLILTENTQKTSIIKRHYDIQVSSLIYNQHSSDKRKEEILGHIMAGKNVAQVVDAGTPGISDPGNELIDFLVKRYPDINIVPIPGPSAIVACLSVSGFKTNKFVFLGFLPKRKRKKLISWLKKGEITFAFYESPNRILKTLDFISQELGEDRQIFIAREMTKMYEEYLRSTVGKIKEKLKKERKIKGEIVVVVRGK